jgi:LPS O-antigen subunit length determinant protein (WzzB/FepE family)
MEKDNKERFDDEIDLLELFLIAWNRKRFIIILTSAFAIFSIFYSLSLPNIYTSSSLLSPSKQNNAASSPNFTGMSGLANLAGVNLSSSSATKSDEAIERIRSFEFFTNYFLPSIKLEDLMAIDKWIAKSNTIVYNEEIFNGETKKWVNISPSSQKAFRKYKQTLNVYEDEITGFITISIQHQSPIVAKDWVELIVYNINESMRELDKQDAQNAINFLSQSSNSTNVQSIREVINRILESKMQTLMLASTNKAYIFKTIDSPIAPEVKSGPARSFICFMGTLIGGIISLLIVFLNHRIRKPN